MGKGKKKHRGHKSSTVHKVAAGITDVLIAGPILIPAIGGAQRIIGGATPMEAAGTFSHDLVGYDVAENKMYSGDVAGIITRDILMVGGGLLLRKYVVRRIR